MIHLFTTSSKYLTILLMLLYTYSNFRALSRRDVGAERLFGRLQYRILLLLHFLYHVVLIAELGNLAALEMYVLELLFLLFYPLLFRRLYPLMNRLLMNNMCLFLALGMIMLERLSFARSVKQGLVITASALLSFAIPWLMARDREIRRLRLPLSLFGIVLLSLVFLMGAVSYGAKMSLSLGGISFQASEFVKMSFVFSCAAYLSHIRRVKEYLTPVLLAAAHILLLVLCKDLGTALLYTLAFLFMLYIASGRRELLLGGCLGMAAAVALAYRLFSHVRTRVFAWRNPWADIDNRGYQITQSLFAIGTGGFFGVGLFQGLPNKIPIVEKDFIFSAISEEMGAVVAICLCFLCLSCFMQMLLIAADMKDRFFQLSALGLSLTYIVQVFLTIGGAIKFIPSTGVTLPFVSYGGSSMVASFLLFAFIQTLFIIQGEENRKEEEDIEEEASAPYPASAPVRAGRKKPKSIAEKGNRRAEELEDFEEIPVEYVEDGHGKKTQ